MDADAQYVPESEFELRKFADTAGLPGDSLFLSHWFGLTNDGESMEDKLPCPSPWNHFARDASQPKS